MGLFLLVHDVFFLCAGCCIWEITGLFKAKDNDTFLKKACFPRKDA